MPHGFHLSKTGARSPLSQGAKSGTSSVDSPTSRSTVA